MVESKGLVVTTGGLTVLLLESVKSLLKMVVLKYLAVLRNNVPSGTAVTFKEVVGTTVVESVDTEGRTVPLAVLLLKLVASVLFTKNLAVLEMIGSGVPPVSFKVAAVFKEGTIVISSLEVVVLLPLAMKGAGIPFIGKFVVLFVALLESIVISVGTDVFLAAVWTVVPAIVLSESVLRLEDILVGKASLGTLSETIVWVLLMEGEISLVVRVILKTEVE